jgi:hypothetical protein
LEKEGPSLSDFERRLLETTIQEVEARAELAEMDIRLSDATTTLAGLKELSENPDANLEQIQEGSKQLHQRKEELQHTEALLDSQIKLFRAQKEVIEQRQGLTRVDQGFSDKEVTVIADLVEDLTTRKKNTQEQLARAATLTTALNAHYAEILSKDLLAREKLPSTAEEWQQLLGEITNMPRVTYHQVRLSLQSIVIAIKGAEQTSWIAFIALELGLLALLILLRRSLTRTLDREQSTEEQDFSTNTITMLLEVLHHNTVAIALTATLVLIAWVFKIPPASPGHSHCAGAAVARHQSHAASRLVSAGLASVRSRTATPDPLLAMGGHAGACRSPGDHGYSGPPQQHT